jgi:peptide/nickel transport system permease protein
VEQEAAGVSLRRAIETSPISRVKVPYLRFLYTNPKIAWSLVILVPLLILTLVAPLLPLQPPLVTNVRSSLSAPSLEHFFGTDKLGRDVFSRTVAGMKVSLLVGFTVAAISLVFGIIFGTISGFYGKVTDRVIMGIVDILLAFPSLLLAIGMVAVLGAGAIPVICAITLADVPRFIRLQRSLVLSLKSRTFIDAARTVKASQGWLMVKHIIPNTVAPLMVAASIAAANAILIEASLSFLGLGILLPQPSLGNIIKEGQIFLQQAWWISALPGVVILLITIALHFFSDGIREILDPKSRK